VVPDVPRALKSLAAALLAAAAASAYATGLANGGFDEGGRDTPAGWSLERAVRGQGEVGVTDRYPGANGKVLRLAPNRSNRGDKLLGVGQLLEAAPLAGQRVAVRARLAGRGAVAVLGVHALGPQGDLAHVQLRSDSEALRAQQAILEIPAAARQVIVYAVAEGTSGEAIFDDVEIAPDAPRAARPGPSPASGGVRIDVDARRVVRTVPDTIFGVNVEWIWDGQGLWSAGDGRLDPRALALAKDLRPTLIRFPGGVFSDAYHWRQGIGAQKLRPTLEHTPGGERSAAHFGSAEVGELAKDVGAALLFTANAGSGTPGEAADWLRYMKDAGTPVRWWEIGNELYMKGDASRGHVSAAQYAQRYLEFAAALRRADPTVRVGAIGGLNQGAYNFISDPDWTRTVLEKAAGEMDFLAVHNAYAPILIGAKDPDPREVYRALAAAPARVERNLARVSELLSRYERPGHPIAIAITEWGPLFDVSPASPWVDHVKTMGSALYVAGTLNAFLRSPRVQAATYFKLNDASFMGLIQRRGNEWAATAPYDVFALYRRSLHGELIEARVQSPTFATRAIGVLEANDRAPVVDAVASADASGWSVIATNRLGEAITARIHLAGLSAAGASAESVSADSYDANTGTTLPNVPGLRWAPQASLGRFARGSPGEIHVGREALPGTHGEEGEIEFVLRPYSVTSISGSTR
jgi:alpha-N-arabinofuranosidase